MTDAPLEMKRLGEELAARACDVKADCTSFPSGSAMLDVRRGGRAYVMAYSPEFGFGVDELHRDDGFVNRYSFLSGEFELAARRLRDLVGDCVAPTLSLVVLNSGDIEAARDFYSLLGLSFVAEQHGSGPRHYAATLGTLVLEIYPCQGSDRPGPARLGFRVPSLEQALASLRDRGTRIISEPMDSPWGRRAVVEDADGNRVELTQNSQ